MKIHVSECEPGQRERLEQALRAVDLHVSVNHQPENSNSTGWSNPQSSEDIIPFHEEERRIILRALRLVGWNVREAAQRLQLGRATLYRKIDRYDLRRAG